jgi:outer membrane protein TolC
MARLLLVCTLFCFEILIYNVCLSQPINDPVFADKLVQEALKNHPINRISALETQVAQHESKVVGAEWSTLVGANGNLNEFTIQDLNGSSSTTGNLFFPRYNVYVRLPLSILVESPKRKKVANSKVELSRGKADLAKLELKADVLRLYSDYSKNQEVYILLNGALIQFEQNFKEEERKFKSGDITFNQYSTVLQSLNNQRILVLNARNEMNKSRLSLEELVGVRLDEIK